MTPGEIWRRVRYWLTRDRQLADLDEEMRLHVELRAEANRRRGMADDESAAAARRRFGNRLALRERSRDVWGWLAPERVARDVRFAWRQTTRRPVWTATAVLILAMGIGANTAMFTLLEVALFRPAPAARPAELVWISSRVGLSGRPRNVSSPDFQDLRGRRDVFADVAAYSGVDLSFGGANAERVYGVIASGSYFDVLGVGMQLGRGFAADEDAGSGQRPVVILSDGLWRRRFGADLGVVGRSVTIDGRPFTVIGVAPRGFTGVELAEGSEAWVPLSMLEVVMHRQDRNLRSERGASWLRVVGRLAPGVTIERAAAVVDALSRQADRSQAGAGPDETTRLVVTPMTGGLDPANREDLAPVFGLLAVVPALVLLVACANVAGMLLSRHLGRRREFALRRALGASRARLVAQLLIEAALLAAAAAAAGVGLSFVIMAVVNRLGEVPAEFAAVLTPDLRVLVATTLLSLVTVVLFGLAPAASSTRDALVPALKDDDPMMRGTRRRWRGAFVVAQMAVSVMLLVVAGLFLRSLGRALDVDPGFDVAHTASVSFDLDQQGYAVDRQRVFNRDLLARAAALPSVQSAALASPMPMSGRYMATGVKTDDAASPEVVAGFSAVSRGYFATLGIPVVRGRDFGEQDVASGEPVAIVNETLAAALWPDADPVGRVLQVDEQGEPARRVIAVVRGNKYHDLREKPDRYFYLPVTQYAMSPMSVVVRSAGDPAPAVGAMSSLLRGADPDLPVFRAATVREMVRQSYDAFRAASSLIGVLGVLAVVLAAVGLSGVTAQSVASRTREIGVRVSLGASRRDVTMFFVREGLGLAGVGVVVGLSASAALSGLVASFLFGLAATDLPTFLSAAAGVCVVAALASYLPARRAASIDPLTALRRD